MSASEWFEVDFDAFVRETEKAICVCIDREEHWFPRSQLRELNLDAKTVEIPDWMAVERGLA